MFGKDRGRRMGTKRLDEAVWRRVRAGRMLLASKTPAQAVLDEGVRHGWTSGSCSSLAASWWANPPTTALARSCGRSSVWAFSSSIAGLTRTNCMALLHEGGVKMLKELRAHLKCKLLIIWDGLKAHRSKLVREYLDSTGGDVQMAFLPPYSPDLNPGEFLWAWPKRHALANFCPNDFDELNTTARNKVKSAQRRPSIIAACWAQAEWW